MRRLKPPIVSSLVIVVALGLAVGDNLMQRAAFTTIRRHDPSATIVFRNRLVSEHHVADLRRRFDGAPLPFDQLTLVWVNGPRIDDAAVREICETIDRIGPIDRLNLWNTSITDAGVAAIANSQCCQHLELRYFGFSPEPTVLVTRKAADLLARGDQIRALEFVGVPLGDDGAAVLATSSSLRKLSVTSGDFTDAALVALVKCRSLTHLTVQNRGGSGVTRQGAWFFRQARPEVFFHGPEIPQSIPKAEIDAYRRERDRLRRQLGLAQ